MSEELDKHFQLNRIFPKTDSILKIKTKKIDEIFKDALFVLDTNTLLAPFQAGKEGIDKIGKIYSNLVTTERIYIPKHVLREFAKNRSLKISELYTNIDNIISSVPTIKSFEYPILSELEVYKTIEEKRNQILKELKTYNEYLAELKEGITNWNWADPVSTMYSNTFNEKSIIDTSVDEDELLKEYNERIKNEIPPGNKDKAKEYNAIGDFLIWKTILELGKRKQKDIVFISNDEKNDWLLKGNKKSIHTKFELVHEFYNETSGKNFVSISFSKFLELQGVEIDLSFDFSLENLALEDAPNVEDKSYNLKDGSLYSLKKAYSYITDYLNDYDDDQEDLYITSEVNEAINNFISSYRHEFFGTSKWKKFMPYLFKLSDLLTNIKSLNYEITYQSFRQKRSTFTHQVEMKALCDKFIEIYEDFEKVKNMLA